MWKKTFQAKNTFQDVTFAKLQTNSAHDVTCHGTGSGSVGSRKLSVLNWRHVVSLIFFLCIGVCLELSDPSGGRDARAFIAADLLKEAALPCL